MNLQGNLKHALAATWWFCRAQNVFFTLACFQVLHSLSKLIHGRSSLLSSLSLSTYPLLFFFSLLYYTDNGSTLSVLLGYWLALKRHNLLAALVSREQLPCPNQSIFLCGNHSTAKFVLTTKYVLDICLYVCSQGN